MVYEAFVFRQISTLVVVAVYLADVDVPIPIVDIMHRRVTVSKARVFGLFPVGFFFNKFSVENNDGYIRIQILCLAALCAFKAVSGDIQNHTL